MINMFENGSINNEECTNIYKLVEQYKSGTSEAMKIWCLAKANKELYEYEEIIEYLKLLKIFHKKRIWEVIFTIGIVDYREINWPDISFIEDYFLHDCKMDRLTKKYYKYEIESCAPFSGLIPYCLERATKSTLYYNIVIDLVDLLIKGIKAGGIQCIRFAIILYRFINECKLIEKDKKELIKKYDSYYNFNKEKYDELIKINSIKSYFEWNHRDLINNIIYNCISDKKNSLLNFSCKDKNELITKMKEYSKYILDLYIAFLENVSIKYLDLSKCFCLFLENFTILPIVSNECSENINTAKVFFSLLLEENNCNTKRYSNKGERFNGLIAYCYYKNYIWISILIIKYLYRFIAYNYFYNQNIEFFFTMEKTISAFIDSVNDNDLILLKNKWNKNMENKR